MTATTATIHLIDDDESFRGAIARMLELSGYQVREYGSAGDFLLQRPAMRAAPGCILLDLRMPGPSGLELHEAMAATDDALPVIFLSGHGDVSSSVRAMKGGAVDFLTKPVEREALLGAVRTALAADGEKRAQRAHRQELTARLASLLPREREVFDLVVAGKLNKQIGAELGIAERTVKVHRAQVMEKMRAASLAELVTIASELNRADSRR